MTKHKGFWWEEPWTGEEVMGYKTGVIREYKDKFGLDILVETGTYAGDTVEFGRHRFRDVYSVEIDPRNYEAAKERFKGVPNVHLYLADTEDWLPEIVKLLSEEGTVYWLDAHKSGEGTPYGKTPFPVLEELGILLKANLKNAVVLMDDIDSTFFQKIKAIAPEAQELGGWIAEMRIARGIQDGY